MFLTSMPQLQFSSHNTSADNDNVSLQLPADDEALLNKLREESRAVFLQRKSRELLDNEELQVNPCKTRAQFQDLSYRVLSCVFLVIQ